MHFFPAPSCLFFLFDVFMKPDEQGSWGSIHMETENTDSSFHSCFRILLERETFKAFYKY